MMTLKTLFYLIFEKLLGGNAHGRIHRARFPEGGLTKGDFDSGEFTAGGFSCY